ncbi:MAG: hypothetical protein RLP09_50305 [Sandaracinaceae bacterium]
MLADVRADPDMDGMDLTCDALSAAVGFTGERARLCGLVPVEPGTPPCP